VTTYNRIHTKLYSTITRVIVDPSFVRRWSLHWLCTSCMCVAQSIFLIFFLFFSPSQMWFRILFP